MAAWRTALLWLRTDIKLCIRTRTRCRLHDHLSRRELLAMELLVMAVGRHVSDDRLMT